MGTFDLVLLGIVAVFAVFGLLRGLSGELGSLLGFAAALVVGYLLYGVVSGFGFGTVGSVLTDGVLALLAFWLARWSVSRFVRCCLGGVTDRLLGVCAGALKGFCIASVLVGVLPVLGVDVKGDGPRGAGGFLADSPIARMVSACVDGYVSGARGE